MFWIVIGALLLAMFYFGLFVPKVGWGIVPYIMPILLVVGGITKAIWKW